MTLTAFLSLLSPGSHFEQSTAPREQEHVDQLKQLNQSILYSQRSLTQAILQHGNYSESRETYESVATLTLFSGTMIANYALCFPVVVARHRLQAFPSAWHPPRTPWKNAQLLWYQGTTHGIYSLYPGVGLGLLGQGFSSLCELGFNELFQLTVIPVALRFNLPWKLLTQCLEKCVGLGMQVLLYPLHRTALILRVQHTSAMTQRCIFTVQDFITTYQKELACFLPHSKTRTLPLLSVWVPYCLLSSATERLLMFLYRRSFALIQGTHYTAIKHQKREDGTLRTFYPEMMCSVTSSILARVLSYPMDTILFKLMLQDSGVHKINTSYKGFWDCVRNTWHEEGIKAFYVGWSAGVLEIVAGYCVLEASWWVYRCLEKSLGSPCTTEDQRLLRKACRLKERMAREKMDE
ncbi:mitochondrial carrier domain-containing protein [Spinellus fusiger]|nr:mitochondrial carrier domain-containing protein [Spinellus fusiger]